MYDTSNNSTLPSRRAVVNVGAATAYDVHPSFLLHIIACTMRRQTNAAMPAEHAMSNMYRVRPAFTATSGKVVMPGPFMVFAAKTRMAVEDRWWIDFMRGGGDIIVIVDV